MNTVEFIVVFSRIHKKYITVVNNKKMKQMHSSRIEFTSKNTKECIRYANQLNKR